MFWVPVCRLVAESRRWFRPPWALFPVPRFAGFAGFAGSAGGASPLGLGQQPRPSPRSRCRRPCPPPPSCSRSSPSRSLPRFIRPLCLLSRAFTRVPFWTDFSAQILRSTFYFQGEERKNNILFSKWFYELFVKKLDEFLSNFHQLPNIVWIFNQLNKHY